MLIKIEFPGIARIYELDIPLNDFLSQMRGLLVLLKEILAIMFQDSGSLILLMVSSLINGKIIVPSGRYQAKRKDAPPFGEGEGAFDRGYHSFGLIGFREIALTILNERTCSIGPLFDKFLAIYFPN